MKIYIADCKEKFDLWDYLHLQSDTLEINFEDIKVHIDGKEDKDNKIKTCISVELKETKGNHQWEYYQNYNKLFQILKLFVKKYDSYDIGEKE